MTMTREQWEEYSIKRYGSLEAAKEANRHFGQLGGKAEKTRPQGFAVMAKNDPERHRKISTTGGLVKKK
jgi:hypothetical protein